MQIYLANFVNGLQNFVLDEIEQKIDNPKILDYSKERVVFSYSGEPKVLLELRSIDELFFCLWYLRKVNRSRSQLGRIDSAAHKANLRQAINIAKKLGLRWRGKLSIRVRAKMKGKYNFRRVDTRYAVEHGLLARRDNFFRLDRKNPNAEIWIETRNQEAHLLWRLTDKSFKQHGEKEFHLPASLRPTVAYAMVQESQPYADEVFLDPMCGTATILLERAHSGYYHYLLGGDIDSEAVQAALTNIGQRHKPRQLFWWDAIKLPLKDNSVDKIVCNLPFGQKLSLPYPNFYRDFLKEARRVLHPKGKTVLLVSDKERLIKAAKEIFWKVQNINSINLLGQKSFIITIQIM